MAFPGPGKTINFPGKGLNSPGRGKKLPGKIPTVPGAIQTCREVLMSLFSLMAPEVVYFTQMCLKYQASKNR